MTPEQSPQSLPPHATRGSVLLTLNCFYHTLAISIPTVTDALLGRLLPISSDIRLRRWARNLMRVTRTTVQVSGLENIPTQACIVMSNHQSLSDIPVIYDALPERVRLRMVAKEELFRVPIWGRAMRLSGFVPINRGNRSRAIASLEIAKVHLGEGTFIWIAPEGTRSHTGALNAFKKGGFIMARDSGVPILPICLKGSRQVVPTQGWKTYFDNTVQVIFKPLIQTAGRSLEDVMADVRLAVDPML